MRKKFYLSFLGFLFWVVALVNHAQAQITWQVQSDYFGERNAIAQPRTIRGMALSDDGSSVYTGLIQSPTTGSTSLRKVKSHVLAIPGTDHVIFGNGMPGGTGTFGQVGGQPVYAGGATGTFEAWRDVGNSPEGIDTDDRGYVYVALSSGTGNANRIDIFTSDLTTQVGTFGTGSPTGIHIYKSNSIYYAYTLSSLGLQRWNVTNINAPVLDPTYTPGVFGERNLTIDSDGTVFVAGNNLVRRISPGGVITHSTLISNAADVAVFANKVYVIKRQSPTQPIVVLNKSNLSSAGPDLSVPDFGIPRGTISQFTSIDVDAQGRLFVSEENYRGTDNGIASYTPPATSFNPTPGTITGRIYHDRVVISSPVEVDSDGDGVLDDDDCAPLDDTKWQSSTLYTDADGDSYTVGNGETVCYGATIPSGYSTTKSASDDCDDNNSNINPGASEICGNGIDDDCDGEEDEFDMSSPTSFVLLAQELVELHTNNVTGNVGVWQAGKTAKVKESSTVNGTVRAPVIEKDASSTITTQSTGQAPNVSSLNFKYNNEIDPSFDINVPDNGNLVLSDNKYRKITVGKNATVTFTGHAIVYIKEFFTKDGDNITGTRVNFSQGTDLVVRKTFDLGKRTQFNQVGSNKVDVYVEEQDVKIDESSKVTANIDARFKAMQMNDGKVGNPTVMTGRFIARKIVSKKHVNWNYACPEEDNSMKNMFVGTAERSTLLPEGFSSIAYPNPVLSSTVIRYDLPVDSKVSITLFDPMGRVVSNLVDGTRAAGSHFYHLDASRLAAGVYYYKIIANAGTENFTKGYKLVIIK